MLHAVVITVSLILQIVALVMTARIARSVERSAGWALLAVGLILIFVRRLVSLGEALHGVAPSHIDVMGESIALGVSTCLASGLALLHPWFLRRREALAALTQMSGKYRDLVETSNDLIWSVDAVGRWTFLNGHATRRIYGYEPDEMLGRTFMEFTPESQRPLDAAVFERIKAGEPHFSYETVHIRKDGSLVPMRFNAIVRRDEHGTILGTTGTAWDISEERRVAAERARIQSTLVETQKLESLGVLAGGIAHDFNNLLTGMLGNAEIALDHIPEGHAARAPVEQLCKITDRAALLTRQMLAYAGKGRFDVRRVDLSTQVRDLTPLLQTSIPRKVELRLDLPPGLAEVEADMAQLQQVIMNLVINAAEAVGDSVGTVDIHTAECTLTREQLRGLTAADSADPGRFVSIEVKDSGSGMDEDTRRRIFEPFFTTKFVGRGLGLAAVLGIVRSHRGALGVVTAPGRGTTMTAYFPLAGSGRNPTPTAAVVLVESASARSRPPMTVLVVDDEPAVSEVIVNALKRGGFLAVAAFNGREAIERLRDPGLSIHAVTLDLTMPELAGPETLVAIREFRPDVPVIVMSGHSAEETAQAFRVDRHVRFLQKPFHANGLLAALRAATSDAEKAPHSPS